MRPLPPVRRCSLQGTAAASPLRDGVAQETGNQFFPLSRLGCGQGHLARGCSQTGEWALCISLVSGPFAPLSYGSCLSPPPGCREAAVHRPERVDARQLRHLVRGGLRGERRLPEERARSGGSGPANGESWVGSPSSSARVLVREEQRCAGATLRASHAPSELRRGAVTIASVPALLLVALWLPPCPPEPTALACLRSLLSAVSTASGLGPLWAAASPPASATTTSCAPASATAPSRTTRRFSARSTWTSWMGR